ncbi:MAG: bifunctional fructose-bisphosphatase/inositol-phosphate phosphatase [Methanotrichaceae archaeon]|nr:bifunctional fructose-bisphosphatase/inositol-phosphate phosphatase [Methanotrichaceae archaeon]
MSHHTAPGLSEEGDGLKLLCDSMARGVSKAISAMIGNPASGAFLRMGADGTPTKSIDKVAEDAALSPLEGSGMGFRVLSEELGEAVIGGGVPDYFLHLDPLDGTYNAVSGIPFYSISIFISNEEISFGYVYEIPREICYYAEAGRGSWMEAGGTVTQLAVSRTGALKDFSVSAYTIRPNTRRIVPLGDKVRRIRTLGSTSIELCLLASSKLDAFVDLRGALRVVDVAAGCLIVQEAGGMVSDGRGEPIQLRLDMWQRGLMVASNGILHRELLDLIGGDGD